MIARFDSFDLAGLVGWTASSGFVGEVDTEWEELAGFSRCKDK